MTEVHPIAEATRNAIVEMLQRKQDMKAARWVREMELSQITGPCRALPAPQRRQQERDAHAELAAETDPVRRQHLAEEIARCEALRLPPPEGCGVNVGTTDVFMKDID